MIEALNRHDLFRQLAGNPLSITKMAVCYANRLDSKNDLASLYLLMQQGKLELYEDDNKSVKDKTSVRTDQNKNTMSL